MKTPGSESGPEPTATFQLLMYLLAPGKKKKKINNFFFLVLFFGAGDRTQGLALKINNLNKTSPPTAGLRQGIMYQTPSENSCCSLHRWGERK